MTTQATNWQAQMNDNSTMRGGQSNLFPTDVNVSEVPMDTLKVFTIAANSFSDEYYVPTNTWYHAGVAWVGAYPYPNQYTMGDGSMLTVDWDATMNRLKLTQV